MELWTLQEQEPVEEGERLPTDRPPVKDDPQVLESRVGGHAMNDSNYPSL